MLTLVLVSLPGTAVAAAATLVAARLFGLGRSAWAAAFVAIAALVLLSTYATARFAQWLTHQMER